ncbi:MAG: guanylate kinase, partial [Candidatus Omnitrophica bacterium]|nr:guanylate kinase [Candidatus Omnitrophota bacterium]
IISGPSGSGKTTLYKKLLASQDRLAKSISVTTRPQRPGEQHGRDYFFVSRKMFDYKKRAGHFLESMKVFDNYYGTPKSYVYKLTRMGQDVLLCIDVKGAEVVRRKFPGTVSIFIKTPSLKVLRKRLTDRGSEDQETVDLRIKTAKDELKEARNYNYVLVNDNLQRCFAQLRGIILHEITQ